MRAHTKLLLEKKKAEHNRCTNCQSIHENYALFLFIFSFLLNTKANTEHAFKQQQ